MAPTDPQNRNGATRMSSCPSVRLEIGSERSRGGIRAHLLPRCLAEDGMQTHRNPPPAHTAGPAPERASCQWAPGCVPAHAPPPGSPPGRALGRTRSPPCASARPLPSHPWRSQDRTPRPGSRSGWPSVSPCREPLPQTPSSCHRVVLGGRPQLAAGLPASSHKHEPGLALLYVNCTRPAG